MLFVGFCLLLLWDFACVFHQWYWPACFLFLWSTFWFGYLGDGHLMECVGSVPPLLFLGRVWEGMGVSSSLNGCKLPVKLSGSELFVVGRFLCLWLVCYFLFLPGSSQEGCTCLWILISFRLSILWTLISLTRKKHLFLYYRLVCKPEW